MRLHLPDMATSVRPTHDGLAFISWAAPHNVYDMFTLATRSQRTGRCRRLGPPRRRRRTSRPAAAATACAPVRSAAAARRPACAQRHLQLLRVQGSSTLLPCTTCTVLAVESTQLNSGRWRRMRTKQLNDINSPAQPWRVSPVRHALCMHAPLQSTATSSTRGEAPACP